LSLRRSGRRPAAKEGSAMQYVRAALYALPTLLILGGAANAQERRHVNIEAQVRVEHDSNVARSSEAAAAARGVDRADTLIRPSIAADILIPLSRQSAFLRGSIGHDYYTNNDFLDSGRYDVAAGFNLHAGPCDGSLWAAYQYYQSDLQDLSIAVTRNIEKATSEHFNVACGGAVGLVPTLAIDNVSVRNSAPFLATSDYDRVSTTVGLGYRRPTFGVVSAFVRHDEAEYENRLLATPSGLIKDGYEVDAWGVRYERRLGARIEGEASVSYTQVKPDAPSVPDFKGATYSAVVDFRASSRIKLSALLERSANPTIRPGAAYGVDQTARLDATYTMNARWKLNAGVLQGTSRYKGASLVGGTDLTKEDVMAIYGGARWDVGRRVAFIADARHEERDANLPGLDYSSNRVGLTAIAKF
jgi:hypothetical protein